MNIFGGRPGFAAGITAIIAILAVAYLNIAFVLALLICAAVALVISVILCLCKYISAYRTLAISLIICVFAISLVRGGNVFYGDVVSLRSLSGEERYVHATVTERGADTNFFTSYTVSIHGVDGSECDYKAILNCNYSSDLQKGYEFVLRNANIIHVDDIEHTEAMSMISEEIYLLIETSDPGDCAILSENNLKLTDRFDSFNSYLCAKLNNEIGGEQGKLAAAMLLGDKYAISSQTSRDFSRSGLSHYLAVSGLHVSIVTGIVSFFLMRLRIRRSYRNILLALFAVGYLFLLGFPVSAVRAVAMLLIVFLAYSMGDNADPINSLGIAASLIIIVSPTSVFDVSFILSFTATLGIVCFVPVFNSLLNKLFPRVDKENKSKRSGMNGLKKFATFVLGTLMSTASALALTLFPVAYFFEKMSVYGFVSNLAAAFLGLPMLASALLYLLLGDVPFVGQVIAAAVRLFSDLFTDLAFDIGNIDQAVIPLISDAAKHIVIFFTFVVYLFLTIKLKHKKPLMLLPAAYPLILFALVMTSAVSRSGSTELIYQSMSGYDTILVTNDDSASIIDLTEGSLNSLRLASRQALQAGYTEIDNLILTHYHNDHISAVTRFVLEEKVRKVIFSYPENEADAWVMIQIADNVAEAGCEYEIIPCGESYSLAKDLVIDLSEILRIDRSNHPVLYCSISKGGDRVTYIGESSWEGEGVFGDKLELVSKDSSVLIYGLQGPVAKVGSDIPFDSGKKYIFCASLPSEIIIPNEIFEHATKLDAVFDVVIWKYIFTD